MIASPPESVVETKTARKKRLRAERKAASHAAKLQQRRRRNKAVRVACSEYWIEAVVYGHEVPTDQPHPNHLRRDDRIYPSTPCRCVNCRGRRHWPNNAYVSSQGFAFDCIMEGQKPDPDLEEELERLRGGSASFVDQRAMRAAHRRSETYRGG